MGSGWSRVEVEVELEVRIRVWVAAEAALFTLTPTASAGKPSKALTRKPIKVPSEVKVPSGWDRGWVWV